VASPREKDINVAEYIVDCDKQKKNCVYHTGVRKVFNNLGTTSKF
jgi:hypothetical protein